MANVFDTAKYILEKSGKMSTMKLQKLCYYSQAWALVWDDAPLFDEDFSGMGKWTGMSGIIFQDKGNVFCQCKR